MTTTEQSTMLRFPLTAKSLGISFKDLQPAAIHVDKKPGWHEAQIEGEWSLARLRAHFKVMGFKPIGPKDNLAFINQDETVGLVLQGMRPHPTKNTWRSYSVEVQARPRSAVKADRTGPIPVSYMTGL